MSQYIAFRRQPVPQQYAQQLQVKNFPAPTRGLIMDENESFMQPGGALVSDNWVPTLKGVKLRGGTTRYCDLHALDGPVWANNTAYALNALAYDNTSGTIWKAAIAHTSPASGTFAADRAANPTRWVAGTRTPVISAFQYVDGNIQKMYAGQATRLVDVTAATPVLIKGGQTSGNYSAAQMSNASGNWQIALTETGDPPLRYNGSTWTTLDPTAITAWANSTAYAIGATAKDTADNTYWKCTVAHTSAGTGTFAADRSATPGRWTSAAASDSAPYITGPPGSLVVDGRNLSYVAKYRNRLYFIQTKSMIVWYLQINSVGGVLTRIDMSGAATRGGYLKFIANWSIDAGDGIDDKLVIATSEGEILIYTGNDPADVNTWRQEGRYQLSPPMGMNAFTSIGGDLIILTVDGMIPVSQAITKTSGQLELAMLTRSIKPLWRDETNLKRAWSWTIEKWDEYGGIFVTTPGGDPGNRYCLAANNATGAWARLPGIDATCFVRLRGDMFFGNQDGRIMQMERTGFDDGMPYVATLVGGWEMFGGPANTYVWHQARAVFASGNAEPFEPQLSATTDYIVVIPPPPNPGPDPGVVSVWDQGLWDVALWDQPAPGRPPIRNTMWQSIGMTGFAHAPIVQVTVAQTAVPRVELIAVSATYEPAGVNVD